MTNYFQPITPTTPQKTSKTNANSSTKRKRKRGQVINLTSEDKTDDDNLMDVSHSDDEQSLTAPIDSTH